MEDKIKVYATFDTQFQTWNIVDYNTNECLHYGQALEIDCWMRDHKDTHIEIDAAHMVVTGEKKIKER